MPYNYLVIDRNECRTGHGQAPLCDHSRRWVYVQDVFPGRDPHVADHGWINRSLIREVACVEFAD